MSDTARQSNAFVLGILPPELLSMRLCLACESDPLVVCTLQEFLEVNEDVSPIDVGALIAGEMVTMGGGASPVVKIRALQERKIF